MNSAQTPAHEEILGDLESGAKVVAPVSEERCCVLAVGGMTCSNCSSAVERA
eukprot:CAMPEP_0168457860 /NCGR_PEP_ID=MMETSP0228-20121227/52075_1 /TAXON_ID=133427 /ORGANISM="Protoceratium reticulatum, Strain CCCM 535 (=CCMP 1889)" /LENGTH=51 /DNA_ID=CAMNT_0008472933 /DNA_START=91 /DNA_END=242 /DNA_ORIENTATION=+